MIKTRIVLSKPGRTALGIEDYEIEGALDPVGELDSAVEMTQLAAGAADDIDTADTLAVRAEALEDLSLVADTTEAASQNDLVLTEIISDLATHGTDLTTEENVVPSLESYVGTRIATEGIKETIENMGRALVEFLKSMWEKIKAFFGNVDAQVSTLKKKLREAAGRASDSSVTEAKAKVAGLCIGGKAPSSAGDLVSNLNASKGVLDELLVGYAGVIVKHTAKVKEALAAKDVSDIAEKAMDVAASFVTVVNAAKPFVNKEILGNVKLTLDELPTSEREEMGNQITKFKFFAEDMKGDAGAKEFEVTVEEKKKVFDLCLAELDLIEDFRRNRLSKLDITLNNRVQSFSINAMAKDLDKVENQSEIHKETIDQLRKASNMARSTARLTQSPFTKVVSATISSVRAHIATLDVEGKGKEVAKA